MKLMLALRRALFDSTWEQIIDGCKNYREYCQAGGIEGSTFVQAPARYIEDGSYLETFTHQAAQDPKIIEAKHREAARMERAVDAARALDPALTPHPQECAAAFESRVRFAASAPSLKPGRSAELDARIAALTGRMRVAK